MIIGTVGRGALARIPVDGITRDVEALHDQRTNYRRLFHREGFDPEVVHGDPRALLYRRMFLIFIKQ